MSHTRVGLLRAALAQFTIVALLSIAGGLATFWAMADATQHARLVTRDHDTVVTIARAATALNDAETSLREFALGGRPADLKASRRELAAIQGHLQRLKISESQYRPEFTRPFVVPGVAESITQLLARLPEEEPRRSADINATIESATVQTLLSRARLALGAMRSDARNRLTTQRLLSETANRLLTTLTIADVLVVVLALAVAYQYFAREMSRRAWFESALAEISDTYERAPCGYLTADGDGKIIKINDTALTWLGYTRDELLGKITADALYVPAEGEEIRARFRALAKDGQRFESPCRLRCRDGSVKDVLLSATAVREGSGRLIMTRSIFADITAVKRAEESLRLSEERFRGSFDAAAIGMALVGLEGRFLQVNPSLCEIVGYSEGELLAKTFQDITHPDDLEADLAHVKRLLAGRSRSYRMEKRYSHKNGQVVHVVLSVSLLRDTGGIPIHFVVQIEDITEHKRVEAALRESEERFRNVSDSAPVMIWMGCPAAGTCSFMNRTGLEFLGASIEEMQCRGWLERVHPDDRARVESAYRGVAAVRRSVTIEFRMRRVDGQYRWIGGTSSPRFLPDGSFAGYIGSMADVSERKEAEEAWRASEARFHAFMNHTPAVAFMKDYEGRILYVNQTMERLFEFQLEDVRNRRAFPGMPDEVVDATYRNDLAVLDSGESAQFLETVPLPSGELRSWQVMKFPFRDGEGRLLLGGMAIDVTEQKELERRLAVANTRLKILAASDSLTGLSNRRVVGDTLETAFSLAARHHQPLSVLMIDVDHFKQFNDAFGHLAGDEVLKLIAAGLRSIVRSSDLPGRYGGEEFIVVLPETDAAGALELGERLRETIAAENWPHRGVTISIGAASLESTTPDAMTLVAEADRALYESKRRGRNLVTHHDAVPSAEPQAERLARGRQFAGAARR